MYYLTIQLPYIKSTSLLVDKQGWK